MPSTAPTATASMADDETALSTVETAQSTSRPRASAIDRMLAIASLRDLVADRARRGPRHRPRPATPRRCSCRAPCTRGSTASVMNVPALAARAAAGRDPHDRRQRRLEQCGHDPLRRVEAAARRVERDDQAGEPSSTARLTRFLDVAGHHVVDDAGGRDHVDGGGRIAGGRRAWTRIGRMGRHRRQADGDRHEPDHRRGDEEPSQADGEAERACRRMHRMPRGIIPRSSSDAADPAPDHPWTGFHPAPVGWTAAGDPRCARRQRRSPPGRSGGLYGARGVGWRARIRT